MWRFLRVFTFILVFAYVITWICNEVVPVDKGLAYLTLIGATAFFNLSLFLVVKRCGRDV